MSSSSHQHSDILQPLPWDTMLRRSSIASRRNSGLSISMFESPFFNLKCEHDENDVDPYAPLSIDEGITLSSHLASPPNTRHVYEHMMIDKSESSLVSVPSLSTSSYGSSSSSGSSYMQSPTSYPPMYHHSPRHIMSSGAIHMKSDSMMTDFSASKQQLSVPSFDDDDDDDDEDELNQQRFKPFHEEKWSYRYKELLHFHKENGHAAVPHTYPKNPQLARWVKRQRRQYKLRRDGRPSTMTTERLQLLNNVGFIWDSHDVNWREKLENLRSFRKEHGHCNVPSNFRDKKLATWVKCQRRQYKLYWDGKPSAMSTDRIAELERIGFEWEIRSAGPRNPLPHRTGAGEDLEPIAET